ncbi:hypothetical protein [Actinomadura kijaniata]|uniref:hypothetical protein n=1 Tax=Actinomadura kijaniata TaxID=46161 RepID=UPI00082D21D3|nr:hypothetical protein [Actinomadura kijaniata]
MDDRNQPIAYWLGVAHRAAIDFIRTEIGKQGITQPQYWILRHLHPGDLGDGAPRTVAGLTEAMRDYLLPGDDLASAAADLAARGLVDRDATGGLTITESGRELHGRVKKAAPAIRDHLHEGVADEDYAVVLRVLRRVMANAGRS